MLKVLTNDTFFSIDHENVVDLIIGSELRPVRLAKRAANELWVENKYCTDYFARCNVLTEVALSSWNPPVKNIFQELLPERIPPLPSVLWHKVFIVCLIISLPQLTVTTPSGVSGQAVLIPVDPASWFGVELVPILPRLTVDLIAQDLGDLCRARSATSWTVQVMSSLYMLLNCC